MARSLSTRLLVLKTKLDAGLVVVREAHEEDLNSIMSKSKGQKTAVCHVTKLSEFQKFLAKQRLFTSF